MNNHRMQRLFDPESGRCLDVAVDHGLFGIGEFLDGIEHMPSVIETLASARPNAIQLSPGQSRILQDLRIRDRPALVMRTDVANVYGPDVPDLTFSSIVHNAVEQAVRLDAACVVVNLLDLAGQPELHKACVQNVMTLRAACDRFDMPLMVEPLVMEPDKGGYSGVHDVERIKALARQAVELGADVVKADPTQPVDEYHRVVEVCSPVPVLVRGGGKVPTFELFQRTASVLEQGVAGIVYGRNIIQHDNPGGITTALMGILHEAWTPEQAGEYLEEA